MRKITIIVLHHAAYKPQIMEDMEKSVEQWHSKSFKDNPDADGRQNLKNLFTIN